MKKWKMGINQEWMRAAACGEHVDAHGHALPQLSSESRWGAPRSRVLVSVGRVLVSVGPP